MIARSDYSHARRRRQLHLGGFLAARPVAESGRSLEDLGGFGRQPQGVAMARAATITDPLWPRRLSAVLGLYVLLGGAISFGGWALDIPRLTDWVDNDV